VTFHREPLRSVATFADRTVKAVGPGPRGPDRIAHSLLDLMVDNYSPVLEELRAELEEIEEHVLARDSAQQKFVNELLHVRGDFTRLRTIVRPQRDVIERLARGDSKLIRSTLLPYFRDLRDNLVRLEDTAANYHERLMMAFDIYLNKAAFEANEGIKFLTALTAITIPIMAIGTWYGMNFEHMPELKSRAGYYFALGATVVTTLLMAIYLKKKMVLSALVSAPAFPSASPSRPATGRRGSRPSTSRTIAACGCSWRESVFSWTRLPACLPPPGGNPAAMRSLATLACSACCFAISLAADPKPSPEAGMLRQIYTEALVRGEAFENLRTLVTVAPGRLAGSKSLERAVTWGEQTLGALKLDRVYQQATMVPHWERGPKESVVLLPSAATSAQAAELTAVALGGSVPGEVTAEVVEVKALDELARIGREKLPARWSSSTGPWTRPSSPPVPRTARRAMRATAVPRPRQNSARSPP
jgi:hypothetical protein